MSTSEPSGADGMESCAAQPRVIEPRVEPSVAECRLVEPRAPRRRGLRALTAELARFGTVGGVAFVVDVGLFNLLRFGPGEVLGAKPITAKVVSVAVAMIVAWLGNRYWTFAHRRSDDHVRELGKFVLANVGGMLVAVGCLAFSHYVLGLTSPLADNIAANVVGLALGTAFRYAAYRWFVFTDSPSSASAGAAPPPPFGVGGSQPERGN